MVGRMDGAAHWEHQREALQPFLEADGWNRHQREESMVYYQG